MSLHGLISWKFGVLDRWWKVGLLHGRSSDKNILFHGSKVTEKSGLRYWLLLKTIHSGAFITEMGNLSGGKILVFL